MEFEIAAHPAGARRLVAALLSLIALSVLAGASAACSGGDDDGADVTATGEAGRTIAVAGGSYTQVTPAELQAMLQNKDFPLINVHIPYEGEIEGTDRHIPYDEIARRPFDLPPDKGAKIVLYCRSGNMSTQAAEDLVQAGYTNIWELAGGMNAWTDAGLSLADEE